MYWVVLGRGDPSVFSQDRLPRIEPKFIGRKSPPFPVYVQCTSIRQGHEVASFDMELERLRAARPTPKRLASLLYVSPQLPDAMTEPDLWFAILNGVSFKGILLSAADKEEQTKKHEWASVRTVHNLRDALIHIVLGGDNEAFDEVTQIRLSLPMDRLSLVAASYHDSRAPERAGSYLNVSRSRADSDSPTESTVSSSTISSPSTIKTNHVIERGRKPTSHHATRSHPTRSKKSTSPHRVYKYIRSSAGVVGSITDPSGVALFDFSDVENVVGAMRARYLEAHGYGAETVHMIVDAYGSANRMEDFVARASGCGMSVVELEWFWEFSWSF
ncbi:hypothetical protein BJ322DRAFT_1106722 [Thelephora terrestris]|uniref:Uncharacterized protein n=1 Tax=Thelephora terrestris TaxID=56493 RepID=A0A9P6HKR6_9AGAM|nr:hypothetical protein BJ322DRAFT_1106722 [Thelephora terrestris]